MNYKEIGKRIRKKREEENMTLEILAEKSEISSKYLGEVERGEKNPSLETLVKISDSLNLTLDYLVLGCIENEGIEYSELKFLLHKCSKDQIAYINDFIKLMFKYSDIK